MKVSLTPWIRGMDMFKSGVPVLRFEPENEGERYFINTVPVNTESSGLAVKVLRTVNSTGLVCKTYSMYLGQAVSDPAYNNSGERKG